MESYLYPVEEGLRYINLNPDHLFIQQPHKKGKGSRGSFKLLHKRPITGRDNFTPKDKNKSNTWINGEKNITETLSVRKSKLKVAITVSLITKCNHLSTTFLPDELGSISRQIKSVIYRASFKNKPKHDK